MRAASGRARDEPSELAAEMLLMLPLEADMDWLREEDGLETITDITPTLRILGNLALDFL